MTHHQPIAPSIVLGLSRLLALLAASGCDPSLGVPEGNQPPIADARVLGMTGQNAVVDYLNAPVEITLDGSFSKDPDGPIKSYQWLSGTKQPGSGSTAGSAAAGSGGSAGLAVADEDGGTAPAGRPMRWVPAGAPKDWPDDVAQPKVTLPEGEYEFVLWVKDEKNVTSLPSTLKVTVRKPLDQATQACVDKVYPGVSSACKACVCGVNDMCQTTLTTATVCDATCWGLVACIATKCPNFPVDRDTSCLVNNCADVIGGGTGATMIAPCVTPCAAQCRSM